MDPTQEQQDQEAQAIWDQEAKIIEGETALGKPAALDAPANAAADNADADLGEPNLGDPIDPKPEVAAQPQPGEGGDDMPEPVRKAIEQMRIDSQTRDAERDQRLKSAEGRVAAMARQLQEAAAAKAAAAPAGGTDAPNENQISGASNDPESWANLKKDFPEWAKGVEQYVTANKGSAVDVEGIRKEAAAQAVAAARIAAVEAANEATVEGVHENWQVTVKTPVFKTWFAQQPKEIQVLADSPKPSAAIKLLNTFATAKKDPTPAEIEAERAARLRRTPEIRSHGGTDIDPSAMSDEQYWAYLAQQEQAG